MGPSGGYRRELRNRGVTVREAWNVSKSAHGPWRISKTPALSLAIAGAVLQVFGPAESGTRQVCIMGGMYSTTRIAGYVTRTSGGVGGRGCEVPSYPD